MFYLRLFKMENIAFIYFTIDLIAPCKKLREFISKYVSILISHSFFRLDPDQFNQVLDAMFECPVDPGHHVIDEGDDGDNFYVIESGFYDVYKVKLYCRVSKRTKQALYLY